MIDCPVADEFSIKRLAAHAEYPSGQCPVAPDRLQGVEDITPLDLLHRHQFGRVHTANDRVWAAVAADLFGDVVDGELLVAGQCHCMLDRVA